MSEPTPAYPSRVDAQARGTGHGTPVVILNPAGNQGRAGRLRKPLERALGGGRGELVLTAAAHDAEHLAREAALAGRDIVAVGGDGTIAEVGNGILASGARVALGIVPAGSGNDYAYETLRLPREPLRALELALSGRPVAMDAGQAALLVRATARVSAVILAGNLLVAARRVGGAAERDALPATELRRLDVATFVAFIVSHTIHFVCVGLLTIATAGANIDARTGYAPVIAVGVLFYLGCVAVMRAKLRQSLGWTDPRQRRVELWSLVAIWLAFLQAYITRLLQSWLFGALAIGLLYSMLVFLARARQRSITEETGSHRETEKLRATEACDQRPA